MVKFLFKKGKKFRYNDIEGEVEKTCKTCWKSNYTSCACGAGKFNTCKHSSRTDHKINEISYWEHNHSHEHKWKYTTIKDKKFGVIFGSMRECQCGAKEHSDSTDRAGGTWRPRPVKLKNKK
jgi:hypothetical protein